MEIIVLNIQPRVLETKSVARTLRLAGVTDNESKILKNSNNSSGDDSTIELKHLENASKIVTLSGLAWDRVDEATNHDTYRTTKGETKEIFKKNGKPRSRRAARFAKVSKIVKGVSRGLLWAGVILDLAMYFTGRQSFGKLALNFSMLAVGVFGGVIGATIAAAYSIIDVTIGWPEALESLERTTTKNQKILGAGWSPMRMEGGMK